MLTAVAWWYLRHTAGGRHFFAIGGDAHAARLAGVKVQRRILLAYLVTGLLVGLASCFVIAQGTSTLDQTVGSGKELAVIAAVVIGGTSIMGGRGSVLGTFLGALLVQSVTSGVTQLGWKSQLSDLFVGIFIIVAVGHGPAARAHQEDPTMSSRAAPPPRRRCEQPAAATNRHRAEPRGQPAPGSCGPCSPSGSCSWPS